MMPNFSDETVGCVAGKLIYVDDLGSSIGKGARSYWNYETFIKESESRGLLLNRRVRVSLLGQKISLQTVAAGFLFRFPDRHGRLSAGLKNRYEPEAVCREETNQQSEKEMRMRVRVISQTFRDLWRIRKMLNPLRGGFFRRSDHLAQTFTLQYSGLFKFNADNVGPRRDTVDIFLVMFILQLAFYATALLAWVLEKRNQIRCASNPLYFVLTSLASLVGFYKFCAENILLVGTNPRKRNRDELIRTALRRRYKAKQNQNKTISIVFNVSIAVE
jgi:hypothetical protein